MSSKDKTRENIQTGIPVVVVLGHIDHGKSSILEAIKKDFEITKKEAGGITQHIGTYEVEFEDKKITFIDTPGHEAFSEMRSRGARVADIAILVVAADEGVKPQTKEAIKAIKEANIPMIVALNKIDKEGANPQRVKIELQKEGVFVEGLGGDVPVVETSAKTGQGIEDLLSTVVLVWQISEIKKDIQKPAEGVVVESYLDSRQGPTATLLLEKGRLKKGDVIKTQTTFGKIKKLQDFQLKEKKEIFPGQAGVVTGFEEVPEIGERFTLVDSIESARQEITSRERYSKRLMERREGIEKFLKIILKADVKGSLEVLEKILGGLIQDKIGIKILRSGLGEITDSDVRLAEDEKAVIIGFRVKMSPIAESLAQQKQIKFFIFQVIYDVIDKVRKLMEEKKEKKKIRKDIGEIKTLIIFKTQKRGERSYRQIIGGKVINGEIKKANLEIKRKEKILPGGKIMEIQEQKRRIEKARTGQEIGILYEGKTKIKEGDILIVFEYAES